MANDGISKMEMLAEAARNDPRFRGVYGGQLPAIVDIPPGLWAEQQWSGSLVGSRGVFERRPMIRVQLPMEYARDWTVQLSTPVIPNPNGSLVTEPSTNNSTVFLAWGHHGAREEVQLTWPSRGASVTVYGSYLEVSLTDPGITPLPLPFLGANYFAWVSEGAAARTSPYQWQPVRILQLGGLLGMGASADFIAPPRTRAVYFTLANAALNSGLMLSLRFMDHGVVRSFFGVAGNAISGTDPNIGQMQQVPFVWPAHASLVRVTNETGAALSELTAHFLIDVGS